MATRAPLLARSAGAGALEPLALRPPVQAQGPVLVQAQAQGRVQGLALVASVSD